VGEGTEAVEAEPHDEAPGDARDGRHRRGRSFDGPVAIIICLAVPILAVLGLLLWPYLSGRVTTPIGGDTPWYVARQQAVEASGLDVISGGRAGGPRGPKALGDRPGYPVVSSLTSAATRVVAFDLAYVMPAVAAVALALAAGAFGVVAMKDPAWSFPVYAAALGASTLVARTAVQSHDNLLADVMLVAAGALAIRAADGAATRAAAVVLIAAASITHWRFVVPFGLLLSAVGLLMLPDLIRRIRAGEGLRDAPATRYWSVLGGSALAGVGALALAPSFSLELPKVRPERVTDKTEEWVPPMRLPILGVGATLGAALSWWPRDRARRWALAMIAMWALSVPLAMALAGTIARNVPVYRVAAFALGIPMLVGAALVGLGRLSARIGPIGPILGVALVLAGLAGSWRLASDLWWAERAIMSDDEVEEFTAAATYMREHAGDRPVVFIVEVGRSTGPGRAMRAVLPAELVDRAYLYLGPTQNLLDGIPTLREDERFNRDAGKWWITVERILDEDPVFLRPAAYSFSGTGTLGEEISPGLTLVRGPAPVSFVPEVFEPPAPGALVAGSLAVLGVWSVVGIGWAIALAPVGWLGRFGFAPALGIAMLALVGLAAGRLGLPLTGPSGITIVVATALAGGVLAWWMARRGRGEKVPVSEAAENPTARLASDSDPG
jgi:hypothetical protein